MAFWGKAFVFDGVPCSEFDLMMYDVGSDTQGDTVYASTISVVEETVSNRWKPYFYGVQYDKKLEFEMVFGVNIKRVDAGQFLDRFEMDTIASWLTGYSEYKWLEIEQDDMVYVRYKCMITELSVISYGNIPWALKATVTCDSPYGYLYPQEYTYRISGTQTVIFYNESSHSGYYMPKMEIGFSGSNSLSIVNQSDNNREFKFENVPTAINTVYVDNEHCIITNDEDINLYPYFNYKFFRLKKGYNTLTITGDCRLKFICEFPVNYGG